MTKSKIHMDMPEAGRSLTVWLTLALCLVLSLSSKCHRLSCDNLPDMWTSACCTHVTTNDLSTCTGLDGLSTYATLKSDGPTTVDSTDG
eukprot:1233628-Prymnesium_polylepis.1